MQTGCVYPAESFSWIPRKQPASPALWVRFSRSWVRLRGVRRLTSSQKASTIPLRKRARTTCGVGTLSWHRFAPAGRRKLRMKAIPRGTHGVRFFCGGAFCEAPSETTHECTERTHGVLLQPCRRASRQYGPASSSSSGKKAAGSKQAAAASKQPSNGRQHHVSPSHPPPRHPQRCVVLGPCPAWHANAH